MHIYTGGQEQTLLVRDTVGRRINISVLNNEYRVITALERARIQVFISYYMMGEDVTSSISISKIVIGLKFKRERFVF